MEKEEERKDEYAQLKRRIIFHKYRCIEKLGQGSFGCIYKGLYNKDFYALKFESIRSGHNLLENEAMIMNILRGPNVPYIKSYGVMDDFNVLVMQLLGKSLEYYFTKLKKFNLKTVCLIGCQMVSILEHVHDNNIIHRDIKPDNFAMGLNDLNAYLFILDFGLSRKYRDNCNSEHYPMRKKKKLTGTARYCSINAMRGYDHSRRDDLESIGYLLVYFLKGALPWQGQLGKTKEERYKKILEKKVSTSTQELCEDCPKEFEKYLDYTKNLEFTETPDYGMLRELLTKIINKEKFEYDYIYDWTTEEEKKNRKTLSLLNEGIQSENNVKSETYCVNYTDDNQAYFEFEDEEVELDYKRKRKCILNTERDFQDELDQVRIFREKRKRYSDMEEYYANEVCCSAACNIF